MSNSKEICDDLKKAIAQVGEEGTDSTEVLGLIAAAAVAIGYLEVLEDFDLKQMHDDMVEVAGFGGHVPKRLQ